MKPIPITLWSIYVDKECSDHNTDDDVYYNCDDYNVDHDFDTSSDSTYKFK